MNEILVIKDLSKSFGAVTASDGVNFSLQEGEIHALIGPNGAGKSTLVKQIIGEVKQDTGSILLDGLELSNYNTSYKLSPPLRSEEDRISLIEGIKNDLIEVIVSDHKPEDEESKRLPFAQAATGSIGIETLLSLSLELYHNESLPLEKIIKCLTINPAKILKINKGTLKKGSDADICIFDLEKPWVVKAEELKSKSKNTAVENRKLQGKVKMTLLQGEVAYSV